MGIIIGGVIMMGLTQLLLSKESEGNLIVLGVNLPQIFRDPYMYLAANYPYLCKVDTNVLALQAEPFHATLRLFYKYTGLNVDTVKLFDLDFYDVGTLGLSNTAPILYYAYLDLGDFFFIDFLILGFISRFSYCAVNSGKITVMLAGLYFYGLLIMSIRQYDVIFLSFALTMFYLLLMNLYVYRK